MPAPTLTLLELNKQIKSALDNAFDTPVWIIAEINNLNLHRSGHCYLELVQKAKDSDKIVAQARATIWSTQYRFISSYFQTVTGGEIKKGMNVLVRVSVDFHELYGISLNIRDIDPSYTLGDLEKRKKEIIEKLISEGVFDMNKEIELPTVIKNIAIISSPGAAGYEDFMNQLDNNKFGYSFNTSLFEADMQGANTENSVITAFENIYENIDIFDVAVIIRGGGSKSDLSYFDNYNIAYHITQFPIPVIAGIGHERDESVADMVSHTKMKTPTAVAGFIVDYNRIFESEIEDVFSSIVLSTRDILKNNEMYLSGMSLNIFRTKDILAKSNERCNAHFYKLKNLVARSFSEKEREIKDKTTRLKQVPPKQINIVNRILDTNLHLIAKSSQQLMQNQNLKLLSLEQGIRLADPQNILKRGFSITRINGKTIKSAKDIKQGDELETIINENRITSKVVKNEIRKD